MKINVSVQGMKATQAVLLGLSKQVDYAASRALNATGKAVAAAMPGELRRLLDRPTPFTQRGVRVLRYANRARLETVVGFMDAQAKYMAWQIAGGARRPGREGLRLPAAINRNEFGNIPRGLIAQLVAVANRERKLSRVKARRIAVSNKVELFYGDPEDQGGRRYPRGIYKRVSLGARHQLIPLIVFPVVTAKYKPRFPFERIATDIVRREWPRQFDTALAAALATAK